MLLEFNYTDNFRVFLKRVKDCPPEFRWDTYNGYTNDTLYPVKAVANRLSDGSYTIDVTGFNIDICYSYEGVC